MKRYWRRLLLAMLLGIVVYAAFVAYSGYRDIEKSLESFRPLAFVLALGLASTNYVLRFGKWEYYLARLGIRGIPKADSLLIFLSGFVLTVTPGKVGEVFKSAVLRETYGIALARSAPIVVAERLTDVIGVVLLILLGSASFQGGLLWAGLGALAVLGALALLFWPGLMPRLFDRLEHGTSRLGSAAPKLRQAYESLRVVASPSALLVPTLLSVAAWALEGFALALLIDGFDIEIEVALAMFFYATATLAGALVPVPGGLGVVEAVIQEGLVHVGGIARGPATASMILVRFATLWWAVIVGFLALGILKRRFPALFAVEGVATSVGT